MLFLTCLFLEAKKDSQNFLRYPRAYLLVFEARLLTGDVPGVKVMLAGRDEGTVVLVEQRNWP